MSTYYMSACRDCREQVMWSKVLRSQAEEWHKEWHKDFHEGHNTNFGVDLDDNFWDSIMGYKDLGIMDGGKDNGNENPDNKGANKDKKANS